MPSHVCIFDKHYLLMHTEVDIKSKHYKWNVVKLFAVAAFRSCCSLKLGNIHRKTSVMVSLLNKFLGLQVCNFLKKWLWHRYLSVNIAKFKEAVAPVAAFISTQKRKGKESVEKQERKNFQIKEEKMKTFHLTSASTFWCQL